MIPIQAVASIFVGGLISVTLIDTLGAIASRWLNFNYGYLSVISFLVYTLIGYFVSSVSDLSMALIISLIVGFYDGTVGWKLCRILKANIKLEDEDLKSMTYSYSLTVMLFFAPFFSFMGYLIQQG